MPAVANITLNDAQATPVAHVFEPVRTGPDYAHFEDKSSTQYIGFWKLQLALKRPQGQSKSATRNLEATVRVETPILETLGTSDSGFTPAPTVAYRPMAEIRFVLPERCTLQQRKDLRVLLANAIFGNAVTADLVENLRVPF